MKNPLLLALFIIGFALFVIFYFVSSFFYKKRHKIQYHFYQMFPYEFNYPTTFKENVYGNILFVLATLCVTSFYIFLCFSFCLFAISLMMTVRVARKHFRYGKGNPTGSFSVFIITRAYSEIKRIS